MSRKSPVLLSFSTAWLTSALAFALVGCGDDSGGTDANVQGPSVASADASGMVLAAVNIDESLKTSRIYHYDFGTGAVWELLPAESGNPAVFAVGSDVLLFNRQGSAAKTMRVIKPDATDGEAAGDALELDGLADGDPLDVASLSGTQALLASGLGGKLQLLDYATGVLTDVPAVGLASATLRPVGVHVAGENVYVAHSGIQGLASGSGQVDGTQQLYAATHSGGTVTFVDQEPGGDVDGLPLTASNPTGMVNRGTDGATVVGLCPAALTGCVAGADRLAGGLVEALDAFEAGFDYEFLNSIVDGPSTDTVYAHVRSTDDRYLVIKLNVVNGTAVTIHEFFGEGRDRLFGLAYEQSSRTLFVGGIDGLKGTLTLYKDDADAGSFELDGMPYHAAFVAK